MDARWIVIGVMVLSGVVAFAWCLPGMKRELVANWKTAVGCWR